MNLTHADYTVAWICALPLEVAAAKAMLEEIHSSLPQPKSDHNVYTLGSISGHNVVVACLPAGIYGTISASIVVSHVVTTFLNIRFGLMVGIGGGVPSRGVDIRLGDIVVSKPTTTSSGVIQYDYGKTLRDGRFQHIGSLNKPPPILLKAVSQIESEYMTGKRLISKIMLDALQKNEKIREQFSRPNNDWLFQRTYDHEGKKSNCSACDQSQLINRPRRNTDEPYIHYGLIASGDQVMKDARTCDSIARDLDVLCFEMEAAGLMDELPSLAIRGICDYCDSHKHDQWQGYAALTAAAYATSLLSAVPVTNDKTPREQKDYLTMEEKECLQNLFITDPTDDKNALKRRKGVRAPGTCNWIMETNELKSWLGCFAEAQQEESNILWLYGNPGTGKSTVAIALAEELPTTSYFMSGNRLFAYFFCDSGSESQRTANSMLRGILYTFISQHPILVKYLLPKYATRKEKLFSSFDALWATLLDMCQSSEITGLYCMIDALDECERESQEAILRQIHQTFKYESSMYPALSKLHILITSRPYPEIHEFLSCYKCKNMASYPAVVGDLRIVIDERVKDLSQRKRYPKTVATKVSRILEDKAEGTFLWVGIVCDELLQGQSRDAVKILQSLPRGLHSLYQTLLRSAKVDENDKPMIEEMLSIVAFSRRSLTLAELSEACQLYRDEDLDSRLQFTCEFIELCRLMIVIDGGHVRLLHKSVKDFLVTELREINVLKANATLTNRCIECILHNCQSRVDERDLEPEKGFIGYAVLHWPEHASLSRTEFRVQEHEEFFQLQSTSWVEWLRNYNNMKRNTCQKLDICFSPLHVAAQWGISQLISFLLPGNLEIKDCRDQSPLLIAVQNFQLETVHHLIKNGAQVNALNNMRQNALHVICRKTQDKALELAEILLIQGSCAYVCDVDNMTPYLYVIGNQQEDLALMFLRWGFDINFRIQRQSWTGYMQNGAFFYKMDGNNEEPAETAAPDSGLTALHFSALNAAMKITAFLLRHGADPNVCSRTGDTPLHLAIRGRLLEHQYDDPWITGEYAVESLKDCITDYVGEEASEIYRDIEQARTCVVDVLLANETINVNIANSQGDCPLHVIPFGENYASTLLFKLLERGAEASRLNKKHQTCLHLASKAGNLEAVCKLVDDGCDIALLDTNKLSPLHYAVSSCHSDVVLFLLGHLEKQTSKSCHALDLSGKNLLHYHVQSELCSMEMVRLLSQRGYKIDETDPGGDSALSLYLSSFHLGIQKDIFFLLVENGANPLWINDHNQNLAHLLMRHWGADITILEFLLHRGLDPTARDVEGKEIMHHGAIHGVFSKELVWFLQTKGILRLHVKDSSGKTPLEYAKEQAYRERPEKYPEGDNQLQESFDNLRNAVTLDTV